MNRHPVTADALGVFLIVLGHDATMAANPHAPPETMEWDAFYCLPFLVSLPMTDHSPDLGSWWREPGRSPDVQRALLQVFLN